jgi:hypothetical protein
VVVGLGARREGRATTIRTPHLTAEPLMAPQIETGNASGSRK